MMLVSVLLNVLLSVLLIFGEFLLGIIQYETLKKETDRLLKCMKLFVCPVFAVDVAYVFSSGLLKEINVGGYIRVLLAIVFFMFMFFWNILGFVCMKKYELEKKEMEEKTNMK